MDKKLPSISKFGTTKRFSNNKQAYYSFIKEDNNSKGNDSIRGNKQEETLDDLFNNGQYIFNIPVYIKTNKGDFSTTIVGKVNDHIITSNNQIIQIEDIVDITVN